jgi:hypothetical protein
LREYGESSKKPIKFVGADMVAIRVDAAAFMVAEV